MKSGSLKARLLNELIEYAFNVGYLFLVFATFTWYRRLILAAYDITFTNYLVPFIEAFVLGKVIMIGGLFRLGRGLEARSLIYPTIYKTVVFVILVAVFKVIEHGLKGMWHGVGFWGALGETTEKDVYEILANSLVIFVALLPFFAVKELGRVQGRVSLSKLFFHRNAADAEPPEPTS